MISKMKKLSLVFAVIFGLSITHETTAYRTDITGADSEQRFCEYRKHLTFKPTATCCANKVIKPSLDIDNNWAQCIKDKGGQSDTVEGIGWDIYSCLLKKNKAKDPLTLKQFADLITKNYPEDIKSKIDAEINSVSISSAPLDNYGRLEKIRVTYYDIERAVCEGTTGESKPYGKIEMCSTWKEENHRAGMCCSKSYPVDIRYKSLFDVGEETVKNCKGKMHNGLVKLNVTEMMEPALMEICDVVCAMEGKKGFKIQSDILDNTYYWEFNLTQQLGRLRDLMIPQFLHSSMRSGIENYWGSIFKLNDTIDAMRNYEFADVVGGDSHTNPTVPFLTYVHRGIKDKNISVDDFKYEFMGRRFHKGIMHVPVLCGVYRRLLTEADVFVYKNCKPEAVTEAPAPVEEPKTDPPPPATEASASDDTATTEQSAER